MNGLARVDDLKARRLRCINNANAIKTAATMATPTEIPTNARALGLDSPADEGEVG